MCVNVSVIVPMYKGQKYISPLMKMIRKCSENLDKYTVEIIFVNDYPNKKLRITKVAKRQGIPYKVIENKKNIGIHRTKIVGVHYAKGNYVVFLDQDDILDSKYLKSQLSCMKLSDAVICNGLHRNKEMIFSVSKPMKKRYSFDEYIMFGYPLVSLGQLVIKKDSIPKDWLMNPLLYNGWDDHFLWAEMMIQNVKVKINNEILYVHKEDGGNASFNWSQMSLSAQAFQKNFLRLNRINNKQRIKFTSNIDDRIARYITYQELSDYMNEVEVDKIVLYLKNKGLNRIAIYGMGVFGKRIFEELHKTDICVLYGIDQRYDIKKEQIPVVPLDNKLEKVDGIVVSTFFCFEEVKKSILRECSFDLKVISLLEMLKNAK